MRRLILLLIVGLGLVPVTCMHDPGAEAIDERPLLRAARLEVAETRTGEVRVIGAWRLHSPNHHFDSYSALVALDDGTLLAASDRGRRLRFAPPGQGETAPRFGYFATLGSDEKRLADIEALARDPHSGRIWAAYENKNLIERYGADLTLEGRAAPAAMRNWPRNGGPEAMVRLADGRFIVLSEASPRWLADDVPGVLFAGDPVAGAAASPFRYQPPRGFHPVDMALLPDGRVLILLRRVEWRVPPGFAGRLVLADPAAIRRGEAWRGEVIAELDDRIPSDNYEGLAVAPAARGGVVLWLISDDNGVRLQRTLLLKLLWRPDQKARPNRGSE